MNVTVVEPIPDELRATELLPNIPVLTKLTTAFGVPVKLSNIGVPAHTIEFGYVNVAVGFVNFVRLKDKPGLNVHKPELKLFNE